MQYGRWKVEGKTIGGGGQGQVELVTDTKGEYPRKFALKRLRDDSRIDRIERFKREIDALTQLNHPNIVKIVDYCVDQKPYYYVMEHCEGGSIEKIGGQAFKGDIAKVIEVLEPICDALGAAHDAGIVHRDVKPGNILIRGDGTPVVADFGICYVDESEFITLHEEPMGARNYIAPEMESGMRGSLGDPSGKTDVYALGKVLYWMLSGGSIFAREIHRVTPLTQLLGEQRWEHVHILLDKVVVEKPPDRLSLSEFRRDLLKVRDLVLGNYAPLKPSIGIKCRFCGLGTYKLITEYHPTAPLVYPLPPGNRVVQLRSEPGGPAYMCIAHAHVMSCDSCGHLEFFKLEEARSWCRTVKQDERR